MPLPEEAFLPVPELTPLFITIILSLTLIVMALITTLHPQRSTLMVKSVFVKQHFLQLLRNNDDINERLYLYMIIIACTIEALAFHYIISYFQIPAFTDYTPEIKFSIGLGTFALYYITYFSAISLINWLFEHQEINKAHIFNNILHHFTASLFLFPFLSLTCYNAKINLSILMLIIWACFYILLIYKQLILYIKNIGLFYFFLYFCTTEILPVLIIGKLYFVLGK